MPTKLISKALLGALSAAVMTAPAFAGGICNGGNCATSVKIIPGYAPEFGPMTIRTENPLGHLRSVHFQRSPNVSITRIHGLAPTAGLADAPSGFTGGCHPTSTTYCRQSASNPVQVQLSSPVIAPAPVIQAPSAPQTVRIGGGYDASKFTPRTYGDASFVPGVAYLPTSKVVRDPAAAQQVLDSGRTVAQPVLGRDTFGGTAPHPGLVSQSAPQVSFQQSFQAPQFSAPGLTGSQGLFLAPTRQGPSFGQPGAPVLAQSGPFAGSYGSSVAGDGTYWEKVSGPTSFGSTVATQVICKRQLPRHVVNPVVNVPVPVPVAVPHGCQTVSAGPAARYGQSAPGRWIR